MKDRLEDKSHKLNIKNWTLKKTSNTSNPKIEEISSTEQKFVVLDKIYFDWQRNEKVFYLVESRSNQSWSSFPLPFAKKCISDPLSKQDL